MRGSGFDRLSHGIRRAFALRRLAATRAPRSPSLSLGSLGRYHTTMLDRIRQMLSKPKLSDDAREFITKLASSDIWIMAVGLRGTPAISSVADPAAFDVIADHRIDIAEVGDDDSVFPFNYERDSRQALPFFTTEERARHFATATGFPTDVTVFQPYRLMSGFVATPENDMFDLVLDPHSPAERVLTRDERLLLRSLSTAA